MTQYGSAPEVKKISVISKCHSWLMQINFRNILKPLRKLFSRIKGKKITVYLVLFRPTAFKHA